MSVLPANIRQEPEIRNNQWRMAWRFARRELRGGLNGFRIFMACIVLGVAAIAGVGSLAEAFRAGLAENARALLGADVEIRVAAHGATDDQFAWLGDNSETLITVRELRAMAYASASDERTLVELKGVDPAYPLYGTMALAPALPLSEALETREGLPGAVVEKTLLARIGVAVGDTVRVGDKRIEIRATLVREPDRVAGAFTLGPRLMVTNETFDATGLVRLGSMLRHKYRVRLAAGEMVRPWVERLGTAFPGAAWRIYDLDDAQPSVKRFVNRLGIFLTLVGLTALVIGGVGIANAVASYLSGRTETIATLKCLGATSDVIFRTYFLEVGALALVGIAVGLVLGGGTPALTALLARDALPVPPVVSLYPTPLIVAAAFGVLTTVIFTLWPLARARDVPAAGLFRNIVSPIRGLPPMRYVLATALALAMLVGLALLTTEYLFFARWFVAGAAVSLVAFWIVAKLIIAGASRLRRPKSPILRLALSNLTRPGAPTAGIVMSIGAGLSVLVTVALLDTNLSRQISDRIPDRAPTFFFIDIQADQVAPFEKIVAETEGAELLQRMPNLRGRLALIDGTPVEEAIYDPRASWFVNGERGLTYAAVPSDGVEIVAGTWWPENYSGPPAISLDAHIAEELGIGIGDTLTFNVLGRRITAEIRSLRTIDWSRIRVAFATIFAPGALEGAPQTHVAAVSATPEAEDALHRAVTDRFANVSAVRIRDVLETITDMFKRIASAVRASASVTVVAGLLVLAGAVAAGYRRRVYDAVILKVLGATRSNIIGAFVVEYTILGSITAVLAAVVGTIASYAVMYFVMEGDWVFDAIAVTVTVTAGIAVTVLLGFAGTWKALGENVMNVLRAE
jgi:putative ABC transport system permease protein